MIEAGKHYKIVETEVIYQNIAGDFKSEERWKEDLYLAKRVGDEKLIEELGEYKRRENPIDTYFYVSSISIMDEETDMVEKIDDDGDFREEDGLFIAGLEYKVSYFAYDAFLRDVESSRFLNNHVELNESELAWFKEVSSEESRFQLSLEAEQSHGKN